MLIEQYAIKTVFRLLVVPLAAALLTTSCGRKGPDAPPDTTPPSIIATIPGSVNNNAVPPNTSVTVTFSEPVDEQTITFTLSGGNAIIPCTMSYSGTTAIFTPTRVLDPDTLYTAMVSGGVKDLAGNPMPNDYLWPFMTGAANMDTTPPTVSVTTPADGATNVIPNAALSATFSEAVDQQTISFALSTGATTVPCAMTYSGMTAIFTPVGDLASGTQYTATVRAGVKDLAGNLMTNDYVWSFMTGAANKDTTPPSVSATTPTNGATKVVLNAALSATFREPVDQSTIAFTLSAGEVPVPTTMSYAGTTAIFTPAGFLAYNTKYKATVHAGVKDLAGNPMPSDYTWTFTTGSALDTKPPSITARTPAAGATNVGINTSPSVTFSEAVDQSTIIFTLNNGSTAIPCTMSYSSKKAVFTPASPLSYSTKYTATVSAAVKDLAGNAMLSDYTWTFTTE